MAKLNKGPRPTKKTSKASVILSLIFIFAVVVPIILLAGFPSGTTHSAVFQPANQGTKVEKNGEPKNKTKKILYYTKYWGDYDFGFGVGRGAFDDYGCPVSNCEAVALSSIEKDTFGKNLSTKLSEFDAILFSIVSSDLDLKPQMRQGIERWRLPHQRFVMMSMESPAFHHLKINENYNRFFNWTMTYRWDSDIPRPYGWFTEKFSPGGSVAAKDPFYSQPPPKSWKAYDEKELISSTFLHKIQYLARRKGKIAWVVSNCGSVSSRRDAYVKQLSRYIDVDYFGNVHKSCPFDATPCDVRHSNTKVDNCTAAISRDYKFYLSFENAFCDDYVTEKLFKRMHGNSLVIAYGQPKYNGGVVPPHSVISVLNSDESGRISAISPKKLAVLLHRLDQNDTEYLSYFWWQQYYEIQHAYFRGARRDNFGRAMCQLCEKLHDQSLPPKTYENIVGWWKESANCGRVLPLVESAMMADHFG